MIFASRLRRSRDFAMVHKNSDGDTYSNYFSEAWMIVGRPGRATSRLFKVLRISNVMRDVCQFVLPLSYCTV